MARPQSPPILAQLRSARTLPEQVAALRALKNEVVGHLQRKELWIGLGVLDPIVRTLAGARPAGKANGKEAPCPVAQRPLSEDESVRLQALQLVASFANGGPAFLAPLHAAGALPALLANISPFTNAPQLVVAALRALTDLADACTQAPPSCPLDVQTLADAVFAPQHLESFASMLSVSSPNYLIQSQVSLAAGLISRLCHDERHQQALSSAGVLDALGSRLASVAVARGQVIPGADAAAHADGLFPAFPEPAPKGTKLGPILEAIAAILGESKYRAHRLVNCPAILAVFPSIPFDPTPEEDGEVEASRFGRPWQPLTAMEYMLPMNYSRSSSLSPYDTHPVVMSDSQSSSRTSLGKFTSSAAWDSSRPSAQAEHGDVESPLIPWLVHLVRTSDELERLIAASILASLIRGGVASKSLRETSLGLLVVPLLVQMIDNNDRNPSDVDELEDATKRQILEQAPVVLSRMIMDSAYLQRGAYECNAVKILSKLLKHAYTPVQEATQTRFWSPQADTPMDEEKRSPISQLGEDGQNLIMAHRLKVRESTLKAISALAAGNGDYRRAFLAEDIISYVVESLSEFPRKPRSSKERSEKTKSDTAVKDSATKEYGANPASVIIAGCHVVRMLSRSISILRTALVDHGVALPIFRFMKHPDIEIQIAATAAIANLVIEFSPARELLTENGVLSVLCEHAHSDNSMLRLNALWALKLFVDAVGPDLKKSSLRELGPTWLLGVICNDSEDATSQTERGSESSEVDMDDDVDMQPSDEPHRWLYGESGVLREMDSSQSSKLRQVEDKLAAVREAELNPARRARNDDVAIQEQALDFIRNLIGRPEAGLVPDPGHETTEVIEFMFQELGEERLFEMLCSKLRAKVLHPFSRRAPVAGRETRVLHPQARILVPVISILVHVAASSPRHRVLLMNQPELLKLVAQQASNKEQQVRVALCHLIINLTYQDDDSEAQECTERALALRKMGLQAKMESMKQQDGDLDVRERAKTAAWQIEKAAC